MDWSEVQPLQPVLALTRELDVSVKTSVEAIFLPRRGGFDIYVTPFEHPRDAIYAEVKLNKGAWVKACAFHSSVSWGWKLARLSGRQLTHLLLETNPYELGPAGLRHIRNHPSDIEWAVDKIHWLFNRAHVACPPIYIKP